jgi:RNA-binding protein YlmH
VNDREKILRYYRSSGDEQLAAKLFDLAAITLKMHRFRTSDFLDPYGYSIAETIAAHNERIVLSANGGYQGAERVKAAFGEKDFRGTPDYNLAALLIKWDKRYYSLSHRDVLGALIGLGLTRDVLGDIIFCSEGCQIVLDNSIKQFALQKLTAIGPATVSTTEISLETIAAREEKVKEIRSTVASLRLDVIAAAGFGTSRSKMTDEITAQKLKVNWQDAKNAAQTIKAGDIISMRGRGRVEVAEILGQTKKGRIALLLKRYL